MTRKSYCTRHDHRWSRPDDCPACLKEDNDRLTNELAFIRHILDDTTDLRILTRDLKVKELEERVGRQKELLMTMDNLIARAHHIITVGSSDVSALCEWAREARDTLQKL
jgi:hypothetical protein